MIGMIGIVIVTLCDPSPELAGRDEGGWKTPHPGKPLEEGA